MPQKLLHFLYGFSPDRNLLWKLDLTLVPFFGVMFFLFNMERATYSTAYISGMGEDVGFVGKQYNYMVTCFLVGFAVSQAPFTILLGTTRPKYVFFIANLLWALLTLVSYRLTHVYQFFVVNLLEGIFSSGTFVGAHFMLGSWYKKRELGKRAAVFVSLGNIGHVAGGWIQAALVSSLQGNTSLPAWRWIFVIVFLMALPFVFIGLFAIPDLPKHRNAWILTEGEKQLAIDRMASKRTKQVNENFTVQTLVNIILSWQFWLMPFLFFLYGVSVQMLGNNVMALWMKSQGFSVIEMNRYPTAIFGCAILGTVGYSVLSDTLGSLWQASVAIGLTFPICCSLFLSDSAPITAKFFAFYALGTCLACQALWFSWCADVTEHDVYLRAVTTGWMNSVVEASIAWWPIVFYPVTDAPLYKKGFTASLVLGSLIVPTVALVVYLEQRQKGELAGASEVTNESERAPLIADSETVLDSALPA